MVKEDLEELKIMAEGDQLSPLGIFSRTSAPFGLKQDRRMKSAPQRPWACF